ncbi:hypothetical protein Leryth_023410 [Lithospermum erythrorhizon]|nr:hypothetical protein Leryth_023410 [Lithospermum erythrorhizon]
MFGAALILLLGVVSEGPLAMMLLLEKIAEKRLPLMFLLVVLAEGRTVLMLLLALMAGGRIVTIRHWWHSKVLELTGLVWYLCEVKGDERGRGGGCKGKDQLPQFSTLFGFYATPPTVSAIWVKLQPNFFKRIKDSLLRVRTRIPNSVSLIFVQLARRELVVMYQEIR